jgi:hypothetical protein
MVDMIARLSDLWPIFVDTLLPLFTHTTRMQATSGLHQYS